MSNSNPFNFKTLSVEAPFCNRVKEKTTLIHAAESGNDVVLYAPRRYGKTSLVKRAQQDLAEKGYVTVFADLCGVASAADVASKLATDIYKVTRKDESLWKKAVRFITSYRPVLRPTASETEIKMEITVEAVAGKSGFELLESVMKEIEEFVNSGGVKLNIAFDEFQDIVTLSDAKAIESCMRTYIQRYKGSHFFIGSQRRILSAMFNDEQRPFFRSARNMHLVPLPKEELVPFIQSLFSEGGKICSVKIAEMMADFAKCHPYYTQKLGHFVFEQPGIEIMAGVEVTERDVQEGISDVFADAKPYFESLIQPLPPQQRLVLRAIAKEPTDKLMAKAYIRKHVLGSTSAITLALKHLSGLDHIEEDSKGVWSIVDPIFGQWITNQYQ
ncbi:MAG: ATP-binding protein [Betaproteobacteria bacterium]|nr:ATP-binding protein [Betaproteobacteria bacterium]